MKVRYYEEVREFVCVFVCGEREKEIEIDRATGEQCQALFVGAADMRQRKNPTINKAAEGMRGTATTTRNCSKKQGGKRKQAVNSI